MARSYFLVLVRRLLRRPAGHFFFAVMALTPALVTAFTGIAARREAIRSGLVRTSGNERQQLVLTGQLTLLLAAAPAVAAIVISTLEGERREGRARLLRIQGLDGARAVAALTAYGGFLAACAAVAGTASAVAGGTLLGLTPGDGLSILAWTLPALLTVAPVALAAGYLLPAALAWTVGLGFGLAAALVAGLSPVEAGESAVRTLTLEVLAGEILGLVVLAGIWRHTSASRWS